MMRRGGGVGEQNIHKKQIKDKVRTIFSSFSINVWIITREYEREREKVLASTSHESVIMFIIIVIIIIKVITESNKNDGVTTGEGADDTFAFRHNVDQEDDYGDVLYINIIHAG